MKSESRLFLDEISKIVRNEKNLTDIELSNAISDVSRRYPNIMVNSYRLNDIISRRVKNFCDDKKIEIHQYYGVLPYKQFHVKIK